VKLRQDPAGMTERMLRAVNNPNVDVIGHPNRSPPWLARGRELRLRACSFARRRTGVALEIDCDPARMDLSPEHARLRSGAGCNFSLDATHMPLPSLPMCPWARGWRRRAGYPMERILNFKPLEG